MAPSNIYPYTYYTSKYVESIGNTLSFINIQKLKKEDLKNRNYGLIKSLKGIECGLGVILFIFPLIFLIIEIVFLIFIRGTKEYQVLPNTTFNIFNIIKILCITFSIIFIFLSVLYGFLLVVAYIQYIFLVISIDSCAIGIIIGMAFGYYGFWYYIVLSCAFYSERTKFVNVGSEEKPGPEAQYDINGNIIPRNTQIIQQIVIPGNMQSNSPIVPIQQSQQYMQFQQPQIFGQSIQPQQYIQNQQPQIIGQQQYIQNQQPQIIGQYIQNQQPQIYGQSQQPQQFIQYQQPQTVEIKNNGQYFKLNNEKVDVGGASNRILKDSNAVSSERDNNKPVQN